MNSLPPDFEAFYRDELRWCTGSRLFARDIAAAYSAWAAGRQVRHLGMRDLRRAMTLIGHRHRHSTGSCYLDVALAASCPEVGDTLAQQLPLSPVAEAQLAQVLDGVVHAGSQLARLVDDLVRDAAAARGQLRA